MGIRADQMRRVAIGASVSLVLAMGALGCGGDGSAGELSGGQAPASETSENGSVGYGPVLTPAEKAAGEASNPGDAVLSGSLPRLDGREQPLSAYRGKVVLIVNTASECGFTRQFEGLQSLYEEKGGKDFVVLGFPADDVANQEPRSDEEIAEFCSASFGVSFPMFAKSNVAEGDPVNPVFAALAAELGPPTWNFHKFLLDRSGRPVAHFDQNTEPDDTELTSAIDKLIRS